MAGSPPSADRVIEEFDALWSVAGEGPVPIMFEDDDGAERLRADGQALLRLYVETAGVGKVLAVEKEFEIMLVDPQTGESLEERLVGFVDLIEEDADGSVFITEIKTGARRLDQLRLRHDIQVSLYAAAKSALGYPEAKLRFRTLIRTKKPVVEAIDVRRDAKGIEEAQLTARQVLRAIDHGIFWPVRGWGCAKCPFRSTCLEP